VAISTNSPLLYETTYGNGVPQKVFGGSLTWSAVPYAPRVNGHYYHDSENNHWRGSKKASLADEGSNWTLFKSYVESVPSDIDVLVHKNFVYSGYRGGIIVHDDAFVTASDFLAENVNASSEQDLMALGSTAISRVKPTNPISDLPNAVGELYRDGLPSIPGFDFIKHRRIDPTTLAGNYINYEFAIKPFLSDISKFTAAARNAESLISDYAKNAGKKIRRRYEFPPQITSSADVIPNPVTQGKTHIAGPGTTTGIQDYFSPTKGGAFGVRTDYITNEKTQWFSGCFTYHLPSGNRDFSNRLARETAEMRYLYGGINASTAWNLLPFSWGADWISNAGDVISNLDSFAQDGLVMPYGYIMETVKSRNARTVVGAKIGSLHASRKQLPGVISMTTSTSYKRRRKATPYGFGLISDDFTTRQWAILAALGIKFGSGGM
jgi:hypothetical protein